MYKKNKYLLIVITMLMSIFLNACTEMDNSIENKTSSVASVTSYSETTEDIAEIIEEQITTGLEITTEEQITTELQTTTEELTSIETTTEKIYQMSKEDAEREGYEPCKKCYK